jgi:hypothetical protein
MQCNVWGCAVNKQQLSLADDVGWGWDQVIEEIVQTLLEAG